MNGYIVLLKLTNLASYDPLYPFSFGGSEIGIHAVLCLRFVCDLCALSSRHWSLESPPNLALCSVRMGLVGIVCSFWSNLAFHWKWFSVEKVQYTQPSQSIMWKNSVEKLTFLCHLTFHSITWVKNEINMNMNISCSTQWMARQHILVDWLNEHPFDRVWH